MTIWLPCDCEDEEHEVECDEGQYYVRVGSETIEADLGVQLPCGNVLSQRDLNVLRERRADAERHDPMWDDDETWRQ